MRIGSGIDVHAFGPGDFVMLGGVRVAHTQGVVAHSDGDVVPHALTDALLGAAGLGDIGQHFKDTDPRWKGTGSKQFVRAVMDMLRFDFGPSGSQLRGSAYGTRCGNDRGGSY